jgi:FKBP-type peptidyl-prolyl cis-trans isomerase (trigger factor)
MIPAAKMGDRVRVEYTGPMSEGTTKHGLGRCEFEFTVGSDEVISGISRVGIKRITLWTLLVF